MLLPWRADAAPCRTADCRRPAAAHPLLSAAAVRRYELLCVYAGLSSDLSGLFSPSSSTSNHLDHCLTGDHRVLTRRGWQSITRVQVGDQVLSFNIATYAQEWKPVLAVQSHAVDRAKAADTLFRMQGSGMDVIATRDHRMLLARLSPSSVTGLQQGTSVGYEMVDELLGLTYAVDTRSQVSSFPHSQARAVVRAGFNTHPGVKVVIPGLERVCDWWWDRDGQLGFLRFLGIWLGDGYLSAREGVVGVKQKQAGKQWLEQLLPRVFPRWWYSNAVLTAPTGVIYSIHCPPLCQYLRLMAVGPLGLQPARPAAAAQLPALHQGRDAGGAGAAVGRLHGRRQRPRQQVGRG